MNDAFLDLLLELREVFIRAGFSLVATGLAVYLGYRRLGPSRVSATWSYNLSPLQADRIDHITLVSETDRPIIIFSIQAVLDKKNYLEVESFKPPLVLKPLESLHVKTTPHSLYTLSGQPWEPDFAKSKVTLSLITERGDVKCSSLDAPSLGMLRFFKNKMRASKHSHIFNGEIFDDNARYAITHQTESVPVKTAFIDRSGFIRGDWPYRFNALQNDSLVNVTAVRKALEEIGVKNFAVDDLESRKRE